MVRLVVFVDWLFIWLDWSVAVLIGELVNGLYWCVALLYKFVDMNTGAGIGHAQTNQVYLVTLFSSVIGTPARTHAGASWA